MTYRFSKNVFALTMFFPIALAFHAQNDPEGSTWYKLGPLVASQPATKSDTPYGLTPLKMKLLERCYDLQKEISTLIVWPVA